MKLQIYPMREWGWVWISLGVFGTLAPYAVEREFPGFIFLVFSAALILFGIFAWPALQRMQKDQS
ncbi:MAG: hypothetical protein J0H61_13580 [Alphaproteobacteria bacterium]|nr:hypothetical protein [Alphaproteobacteria bacterium]